VGPGRARQDQPVVAVEADRAGLDRLDLDERPDDDVVPELAQPRGEPLVPALRPR
jgi:hypothetical protein